MDANFSFSVDVPRNLVVITLGGFFSRDDIGAFRAEQARAYAKLQCGPNEHLTLADIRAMKIQAQDIVAAWGDVLADPRFRSRKLAFVQASSLARMQLKRAAGNRFVRYFNSMDEAEAWLFAADDDAVAA
ncbi:hypothetical protein [Sphingomonas sp.]|uniref:hypothetical protein n=1 Tax=Sphingomonas sp. TaxID=28214 RepID=UPI001D81A8D1|nr:hypothetical protein [Sphingomonas sp.]MBX9795752.1 hypothetical protein [Sphingomonas sp.]